MGRITTWSLAALALAATPVVAADSLAMGGEALEQCRDATRRGSPAEAREAADRAEGHYAELLESESSNLAARVGRARVLLECRMAPAVMMERAVLMQRIEADLDAALALDARHWEARFLLATLLYNVPPFLGRRDDAVRHLETLIEQQELVGAPTVAEPYVMLGDLLEQRGDAERAREVWQHGARLYPESEALRERIARSAVPAATPTGTAQESGPATVDPSAAREGVVERLVARLEREASRPQIAGLSVGIEQRGERILVRGFGLAELEHGVPATAQSVYRVGSITKQFTAAAVLLLAEEGALALDDGVAQWLPAQLRPRVAGIELRHLLSHTSGLTPDPVVAADWLRDGLERSRVGAPGERYAYSNFGYALLGLAIEAATSRPWEAVLEERLWSPAGMGSTGLCRRDEIVPHRARGYAWQGDRMLHAPAVEESPALHWAGGLCSTAEDLLRWQRALHGGELLSDASHQAMTSPPRLEGAEGTTYAFGLRVHAPRGRRVYQHSGGIDGFLAEAAYYPAEKLSIVVLMNSDGGDPRALAFELAEIVLATDGEAS